MLGRFNKCYEIFAQIMFSRTYRYCKEPVNLHVRQIFSFSQAVFLFFATRLTVNMSHGNCLFCAFLLRKQHCRKSLSCWVAIRRTYVFTLQEVEKIYLTLQSHVMLVWEGSRTASVLEPQVAIFQLRSSHKLRTIIQQGVIAKEM